MRDQHQRALEKAQARLLEEAPGLLAILVAGSIAKGIDRDASDVDLIVIVPEEEYAARLAENRVGFLWRDICDYENGYVEGRFLGKDFLLAAVERGSEPTRHSFTGVYPVYCIDPGIPEILPLIPVYPETERAGKIQSFLAQMQLNRWYFWKEGVRRGDRYLQMRAATEIVLFGCRLILAHNRQLFACQRRLVEQTLAVPLKPAGLKEKIDRLLGEMTDDAVEDFCSSVISFADWGECDLLNRFLQDSEMSWFTGHCGVSES
ncbi:MAG TPA: hypothetical protein VFW40_12005 [Capsulimonadaceae bacterium]|nr:hypothetical protein [Capsulimonadaceae bacterium]